MGTYAIPDWVDYVWYCRKCVYFVLVGKEINFRSIIYSTLFFIIIITLFKKKIIKGMRHFFSSLITSYILYYNAKNYIVQKPFFFIHILLVGQ